MAYKFQQTFSMENGYLSTRGRTNILAFLKSIADYPYVKITIEPRKRKRSTSQNAYWFMSIEKHVTPLFREAGSNWDTYKIHKVLMEEMGYTDVIEKPNGQIVRVIQESSDFTTTEFSEFIERGIAHLKTVYSIDVPFPNENLEGEIK